MLTLSAAFSARADLNDTRKIMLLHIFYDDTNYLKLATTSTTISGIQYMGAIKSIGGATMKWDITSGTTTISTPSVTLLDYRTPDGYNLITEFVNNSYVGNKFIIYYTYEGLSLSDSLKTFEGITDELNFNKGNIIITGKTTGFPEVNINGRKVNFEYQTIGETAVGSTYQITKALDGQILPIPFGKHWCAPAIPYVKYKESQAKYFSILDNDYSSLLTTTNPITTSKYQYNIGKSSSQVMVLNNDFYTILTEQDWTADSIVTYTLQSESGFLQTGLKLSSPNDGGVVKNSENIFLVCPLRYQKADDVANTLTYNNISSTDAEANIQFIFDNSEHINGWTFSTSGGGGALVELFAKAYLDSAHNLKGDGVHVRNGRLIAIPDSDSNDGAGYLMGRFSVSVGYVWRALGVPFSDGQGLPLIFMMHYLDSFIGTDWDNPDYFNNDFALGAGDVGTFSDGTLNSTSSKVYNFNVRNFLKESGYLYTDVFTSPHPVIGNQGSYYLKVTGEQGGAPMLPRETLEGGRLGAGIYINIPWQQQNGSGTIYKIYHCTAGSVEFKSADPLYVDTYGIELTSSDSLNSTPQDAGTDYILRKNYEYVEFILNEKTTNPTFSSAWDYSTISSSWNTFFSDSRNYSGFVITEETLLSNFMKEYLKEEPFSIFKNENGTFEFKMLQKEYVTGDKVDTIDFNDATNFEMSLSPSKNIVLEIKSLKTDYMYGIDKYVQDFHWRLTDAYDYGFWKSDNTKSDNIYFKENIDKKFTSYTGPVDTCSYNSKIWGAIRTHINETPSYESKFWNEVISGSGNVWSSGTTFTGEDEEQIVIAEWYLNQNANRHRMVKYSTGNLSYLRFQVGDVVEFSNVPYSLLGINIKGFNGSSSYTSSVNGQTVYASFIITEVVKSNKEVKITAMQLHDLEAYSIERVN